MHRLIQQAFCSAGRQWRSASCVASTIAIAGTFSSSHVSNTGSTPRFSTTTSSGSSNGSINVLVMNDREGELGRSAGVAALRQHNRVASVKVLETTPAVSLPKQERQRVHAIVALRERTKIDSSFLDAFPNLEILLQTGGHAYHVDVEACTERGIPIAQGRGATAPVAAVPELTFALMISAMRELPRAYTAMALTQGEDGASKRPGVNSAAWPDMMGSTLAGKRLGLLGCGRHGNNIARIGRAFGMEVVAWGRDLDDDKEAAAAAVAAAPPRPLSAGDAVMQAAQFDSFTEPVPRLPLEEVLRTSDVVSIHLRLSPQSRGLLDASKLAAFKPGAVLINTARGAIVDEAALIEALRDPSAPLAAAGLDVFEQEPLAYDSPLRTLPNAVLTPHMGFTVREVFAQFAAIAERQLSDYLDGKLPVAQVVNPEAEARGNGRRHGALQTS